jgi:uncharacterized protein YxeA|nr:MAG TPA: Protein of unknown function (DUF3139) [Caudoviricetes sp.]
MKKIIIGLCVIIVIQALCIVYMNSAIGQNTKYIEALEQYTKAQIYKKDAQLYLMNSLWNNPEVHKLLADSCKMDCINYKNGK